MPGVESRFLTSLTPSLVTKPAGPSLFAAVRFRASYHKCNTGRQIMRVKIIALGIDKRERLTPHIFKNVCRKLRHYKYFPSGLDSSPGDYKKVVCSPTV